jgi:NosR/NirI family transcriptional regulator, nitrous oxide reductase regulator
VFARENAAVQLVETIGSNDEATRKAMMFEVEAFGGSGAAREDLVAQADAVRKRFHRGGWILGGFIGAVFGVSLVGASIRRTRVSYEPDRGACLSCARCYMSCPVEHVRLKKLCDAAPGGIETERI